MNAPEGDARHDAGVFQHDLEDPAVETALSLGHLCG